MDYLFNDIEARVGLNPVCPRHLESSSFDAFYKFSPMGMAVTSIHEIIHFIWFYVWNKIFNDNIVEYENPHLKWILSEMVVDIIIDKAETKLSKPKQIMKQYIKYFHDIKNRWS